jgi:hypothetical protein
MTTGKSILKKMISKCIHGVSHSKIFSLGSLESNCVASFVGCVTVRGKMIDIDLQQGFVVLPLGFLCGCACEGGILQLAEATA